MTIEPLDNAGLPKRGQASASGTSESGCRTRKGIESCLSAYAAAAGAAGVAILALAQPAKADIIYTPANVSFGNRHPLFLDLNNDGTPEFYFQTFIDSYGAPVQVVSGLAQGDNFVRSRAYKEADALPRGYKIGPSASFGRAGIMADTSYGLCGGNWCSATNRYLGLEFRVNGAEHFGWAEITLTVTGNVIRAKLEGYAYNTVAYQPIRAGQRKPRTRDLPDSSTPEPGTLGLLALGSLGLGFWRRKKHGAEVRSQP